MMRGMISAAMIGCSLVLSGCSGTTVESLPAGASRECPKEWAGAWIGRDDNGRTDSDGGMFVDRECTATVVSNDAKQKTKSLQMHPRFFDAGGTRYVLFEHSEVAELIDWHDKDQHEMKGFWPFLWAIRERDLVLMAPDHRRVATWIVQGALDGNTNFNSSGDGWNNIHGNEDAIAGVLRNHGNQLFDDDKPIRLRRVGDTRNALDAALAKAAKEAARREASDKKKSR